MWDYSLEPKSGKELGISGVALAGVLAAALVLRKVESSKDGSVSTTRQDLTKGPLSSRSIRKSYVIRNRSSRRGED